MNSKVAFGGGCFWCSEAVFLLIDGVSKVTSGYAGGRTKDPTYGEVSTGRTGHAEVVLAEYDPKKVSLERLLDSFFASHDPTSLNRQGNDVGTQYRSIILYGSEEQHKIITEYMERTRNKFSKPVVTEVTKLDKFYLAEQFHQRYFEKHPDEPYSRHVITPKAEKVKRLEGLRNSP